jgi:hypothetical protein
MCGGGGDLLRPHPARSPRESLSACRRSCPSPCRGRDPPTPSSMACGTSLCILARDSGRSCARLRPWGRGARGRWGSPGSPSIWVTSPSFTKTRWPQPTAQYGQMDLTTSSASDVRGLRCAWRADCAALPSARGSFAPKLAHDRPRRDKISYAHFPPPFVPRRVTVRPGLRSRSTIDVWSAATPHDRPGTALGREIDDLSSYGSKVSGIPGRFSLRTCASRRVLCRLWQQDRPLVGL